MRHGESAPLMALSSGDKLFESEILETRIMLGIWKAIYYRCQMYSGPTVKFRIVLSCCLVSSESSVQWCCALTLITCEDAFC